MVSANAEFEHWFAEHQDAWEVPSANNEQGRCNNWDTKIAWDPGTLGMFREYGVGNPPDLVSEQVPSLVNR